MLRKRQVTASRSSWPARSSGRRVLVENPDRADLAAHSFVLQEAGYDVATCQGTLAGAEREQLCPLLSGASCSLVDGADVVVTSCDLGGCRGILAAHRAHGSPRVVLEAPAPSVGRWQDVAGEAVLLPFPVTAESLRAAVASATR